MSEKPAKKTGVRDVEEIKEILGAVSTEVPTLIKSIIAAVFSEEAGKNMGKAAAAFYKELKEGGMPDAVAVKMTEDYISVFTSLGDIMKKAGGGGINLNMGKEKHHERGGVAEEVGSEVERRVKQRLAERQKEDDEDEEEED
jgi:hypothetical protein